MNGRTHLLGLLALSATFGSTAQAADPAVFAAVPDGSTPGIWRYQDKNNDGDATDAGESLRWASALPVGVMDVVVDSRQVVYAAGKDGTIYRIEDLDKDGSALDAGEVKTYRGAGAQGVKLTGALSLALRHGWDPYTDEPLDEVYVLDLSRERLYRLVDRDGDGLAQGYAEATEVTPITSSTPFTASRMSVDELGRVLGTQGNRSSLARIEDINGDGAITPGMDGGSAPRCATKTCGSSAWNEYKSLPLLFDGVNPLSRPFGVTSDPAGITYVSDLSKPAIYRWIDVNMDEDGLDTAEVGIFYYATGSVGVAIYDIVGIGQTTVMVAQRVGSSTGSNLLRLQDLTSDFDARDAGEQRAWGTLASGRIVGLAVAAPAPKPMDLYLDSGAIVDSYKGPKAVVEDGQVAPIRLRVIDPATHQPVKNVRVGAHTESGCLQLCPNGTDRTDANGIVQFNVSRTNHPTVDGEPVAEALKFWIMGSEIHLDVLDESCGADPVVVPGEDPIVAGGSLVTLTADSGLNGKGDFCWSQVDGPVSGIPLLGACGSGEPVTTFTAPTVPGVYTFEVMAWNACEVADFGTVEVTVE